MGGLRKLGALELILPDSATLLQMSFLASHSLKQVEAGVETVAEMFRDYQQHDFADSSPTIPFFQMIAILRGSNQRPTLLNGSFLPQKESLIAQWRADGNEQALQMYYLCGATLGLFFNDVYQANDLCKALSSTDSERPADFVLPFRVFVKGCVGYLLSRRSKKHWKMGEAAMKQFNRWMQDGQANCTHFRMILYALRVSYRSSSSSSALSETQRRRRQAFDDAIDQCARCGMFQFQALTCELAARTLLSEQRHNGRTTTTTLQHVQANRYLAQARSLYQEWDCQAKVEHLHTCNPAHLECQSEVWTHGSGSTSRSSSTFVWGGSDATTTASGHHASLILPRFASASARM